MELIWVMPGEKGRVGLSEKHPDHPGGYAWVAGDATRPDDPLAPVQVALTPAVALRLSQGLLKQVPAPVEERKPDPAPELPDLPDMVAPGTFGQVEPPSVTQVEPFVRQRRVSRG